MKYKHWGDFVRLKRIESGFTLREFCRIIEIDPSNWAKVESGISAPPKDQDLVRRIFEQLPLVTEQSQAQYWFLYSNFHMPTKTRTIYDKLPIFIHSKSDFHKLFEFLRKNL